MARFIELTELFEELEKITSHKEIVKKIAIFFSELERNEVKDLAAGQPQRREIYT